MARRRYSGGLAGRGEVKDIVELAGIEVGGEGIAYVPLVKREAAARCAGGRCYRGYLVERLSTPRTE